MMCTESFIRLHIYLAGSEGVHSTCVVCTFAEEFRQFLANHASCSPQSSVLSDHGQGVGHVPIVIDSTSSKNDSGVADLDGAVVEPVSFEGEAFPANPSVYWHYFCGSFRSITPNEQDALAGDDGTCVEPPEFKSACHSLPPSYCQLFTMEQSAVYDPPLHKVQCNSPRVRPGDRNGALYVPGGRGPELNVWEDVVVTRITPNCQLSWI